MVHLWLAAPAGTSRMLEQVASMLPGWAGLLASWVWCARESFDCSMQLCAGAGRGVTPLVCVYSEAGMECTVVLQGAGFP